MNKLETKYDQIEEIIKLRLQGFTSGQIREQLNLPPNLTDGNFSALFQEAGERIRYIQENEVLSTRVVHAQRYELLYEWFLENDFDKKAMKMLECIEKLLGLHSGSVNLSIHNLVERKTVKSSPYKLENLTDSEHERLKELWQKGQK